MNRDWAPAYRRRKAALTNDDVRRSLELAEEAITVDRQHRVGRLELDGMIFDLNEPGIMVAFSLGPDQTLVLVTFRDLWNR